MRHSDFDIVNFTVFSGDVPWSPQAGLNLRHLLLSKWLRLQASNGKIYK